MYKELIWFLAIEYIQVDCCGALANIALNGICAVFICLINLKFDTDEYIHVLEEKKMLNALMEKLSSYHIRVIEQCLQALKRLFMANGTLKHTHMHIVFFTLQKHFLCQYKDTNCELALLNNGLRVFRSLILTQHKELSLSFSFFLHCTLKTFVYIEYKSCPNSALGSYTSTAAPPQ